MRLPERPVTGGEIYNYRLDQYLKERFDRVDNISWPNRPHRNAREFILKSLKQNVSNISLLKRIRDIDGDVVILEDGSQSADLFLFNLLIRLLRVGMGKRVRIVSLIHHTYAPLFENKLKRTLMSVEESIFANSLDGIIIPSEFTQSLVDRMLRRHVDMLIAHPGLNISGLGGRRMRTDDKNVNLLFVGYLIPRKGVDTLVKSINILVKNRGLERLTLHVVGDAERDETYVQGIREYCRTEGIEDQVIFHGRVSESDLQNLYETSDIFVFPSLWEGFGMALAEAMSYGLPIVTTNAGAIPYLVKDGRNGFLVPPQDPEKLAQSIEKLVASPELRAEFGEVNRKVAAEFSWERSFAKIEKFLDELINSDVPQSTAPS
jgi:glycosyltransferase involved in cell wall biosynthesis